MIKVSVIIPTYNRDKVLIDTIKSVLKQKFSGFELIVVDQTLQHDKETKRYINKYKGKKFSYYLVSPPSLPAARNFGFKKAKGEIVIYIDDDVVLDDGFIQAHFDSYQLYNIGVVAGRVKQKGKKVSSELAYLRKTSFGAGNFNYLKMTFAQTPQGCNMSFRKDVLRKAGGFDTNFIGNAMREETDLAFRLRKLGYQTLFNPKASLYHHFYPTGGCREKSVIHDDYIIYRNEMLFFLRHRPLVYFPYFFAGHFIKYVFNQELVDQGKIFSRLKVFTKGLIVGLYIYFFPRPQIKSTT